jgi:hypothetical protein
MSKSMLLLVFLLISAVTTGSYILLGWLFTVMLHQSAWTAALLGLLLAVGCALFVTVASYLLDSLIVGAVFFGCGVLGHLAGFGIFSLYATDSTGLQALAIIATGILVGFLMMFIRAFLLTDSDDELFAWWALAGYLGAESGAFVCGDLIHHWSWWLHTMILAGGFFISAHRVVSNEFSTDTAFLPH